MILGTFDPLIQPHHMRSREPALVDHDQVAYLYKCPLQIPIHVSAHLPHPAAVPPCGWGFARSLRETLAAALS
jgi:hypothetical protein